MRTIKVFLASSTKFIYGKSILLEKDSSAQHLKSVVKTIERRIKTRGKKNVEVEIIPWWDCFKEAGAFMESLLKVLYDSEIGIFVLGEDKKIKKDVFEPNRNVLIEYGMFTALNKTTYLIKESNKVKLPSDMDGQNTNSLERKEEVISGFIKTLDELESRPSVIHDTYGNVCTYYDVNLSDKLIMFNSNKKELVNWESKALYIGSKSACLWKEIEDNKNYREYLAINDFIEKNKKTFKNLPIDNVISFGPGIGRIDKVIMGCLCDKFYVPIDLNVSLAIESAKQISDAHGCRVPFAIIDDFEEPACYTQLSGLIESKKAEIGRNNLFSFMGVTFSNLSMRCGDFFDNMNKLMKDDNDHLFIDAIIYKDETDEDLAENVRKQIDNYYSGLLRNAIKKKGLIKPSESDHCLMDDGFQIEIISENQRDEYNSRVSIPNTKVICVKYNNNIILIAKHYRYNDIKSYIKKRFIIVKEKQDDQLKRGIFLLKKKKV